MRNYARYLIIASGVFCCVLAVNSAQGQTPAVQAPGGVFVVEGVSSSDEAAMPTAAKAKPGTAAAEAKPKSRLDRLKELKFDRRPSAVLEAWSEANRPQPAAEPEKPKTDEKKDDKKDEKEKTKAPDPLDAELKAFQTHVTLGRWPEVKRYIAGLPEPEQKAAWEQMLASLSAPTPQRGLPGTPSEANAWTVDDLMGLAAARPKDLNKNAISSLGRILSSALERDMAVEAVVARFDAALKNPAEKDVLSRRQMAQLLEAAGKPFETGQFLPTLDEAIAAGDSQALNLLSLHFSARQYRNGDASDLERSWRANQAVLAIAKAPRDDKEVALKRAVDLAQQVRAELGQVWLDDSFVKHAERGVEILTALGEMVSKGFEQHPHSPELRLKPLTLQKTAVTALLKASPTRAREWQSTLRLLALNWLREAEFSRLHDQSSGQNNQLQSDQFGNVYFSRFGSGMISSGNQNQPRPIAVAEVLEQAPDGTWTALLDEGVSVPITVLRAELQMKVDHEEKAFPIIEQLAAKYPERAQHLAEEFLRVWKQNHDPNTRQERYMNPFYFYYGFNDSAQSIPLTRSKQQRNLIELAGWVERLRRLSLPRLDEHLLADAFTTCHSNAEVYRLDAITRVFGPIEKLKPSTLAILAQQMRENLAGLWRAPKIQETAKTRRKTKDVQAEVLRGYGVAHEVVNNALAKYPDEWSLHLAEAAVELDESNFRQELEKDPKFQERRQRAMAGFAKAAGLYTAAVPKLPEDEQSLLVFEQWFYASLGACDLESVDDDKQPDPQQTKLIRAALDAVPGKLGEQHRERFASQLFTHLRSVKPAMKFRYLREGFAIVGDHPLAHDARKAFDYYQDLVTEIKLEAVLDGGATDGIVGHQQPFGVFVNLRHTPELERESGGFGRFLQNQNSMLFGYNFGRPAVDYRDRFSTGVQEVLKENFEVISITFETDKVRSRESDQRGWRITPYAYLLIKARGPQVDKLPPLKIDLDFLDTSGYVVLPVESPAVPLDAKPAHGSPRQLEKVAITQILDERQADEGKLLLEIKASARGLVSELDELLDMKVDGFRVATVEERGLAVSKFDDESPRVAILSERSWLVGLESAQGPVAPDTAFTFAVSRVPKTEMTWQRYQDADLETVDKTVMLQSRYGRRQVPWLWLTGAALAVAALVTGLVILVRRARKPAAAPALALPEPLTAFSVLGLLESLRKTAPLAEPQRIELAGAIAQLEEHYFAEQAHGNSNLRDIAEYWLRISQSSSR